MQQSCTTDVDGSFGNGAPTKDHDFSAVGASV